MQNINNNHMLYNIQNDNDNIHIHIQNDMMQDIQQEDRTVVVLDWDDTLLPSSYLKVNGLLPNTRYHHMTTIPHQTSIVLSSLSMSIIGLMEEALRHGPVFIVTAAERGWVELSASLYLPNVIPYLNHMDVHVVSARTFFEKRYGVQGHASLWKKKVFTMIAKECFINTHGDDDDNNNVSCNMPYWDDPRYGAFNLVSIGDSHAERDACHTAAGSTPFTVAKTLKFIDKPNMEEVIQQVTLAHRSLRQLIAVESSLDLQLTRDQLLSFRSVK